MKSKYFRELDFVNWVDFEEERKSSSREYFVIKGYYFQPWVPHGGQLWKMDIWLMTQEYDKSAELTNHFKYLLDQEPDDRKKIAILEIKQAMRQRNKYISRVDGKMIYRAVLEKGILDVESFKKVYEINI